MQRREGLSCGRIKGLGKQYSKTECEQRDVQFALQDTATNDGMVDLSNRQLARLHPNIGIFAGQLTQINLSNNALRELPDEIGLLRQLQHINLSKNALQMLPSAIAFWQNLQTLDVGDNSLTDLPSAARHLDKLEVLNLAANKFVSVPDCLCRLQMLRFLDLSHNQIDVLPARMFIHGGSAAPNRGRLELLLVEGCPLISKESPPSYDCSDIQRSAIPSLVDTVLHQMIVSNVGYPFGLPEHLQQRLNSFVACDYCHRLYPAASAIKRRSFVCRDKIELPIEYNLCQAHWYDEKSRIAAMFAPRVPEHARDYYKAKQLALALTKLVLAEDNGPPGSGSSTRLLPVKILPRQGLGRRVADAILRKKKHHARDKEAPAFSRQDRPAQTIWQVFEDDIH
ncbi:hypothetical protein IW140_000018 [Coemansia sp. RSA 1813]|nr:hypothetical protein IW140_000018 [Coemansia sp. RSA 1813]